MTDRPLDLTGLYLGDRVVVRYRVDDRHLTDVTGLLRDADDPIVVEGTGPKDRGAWVEVRRSAVTSVRLLSYVTVRNSQIRSLAESLARASAVHTELHAGWLLRSESTAPLENSALPIGVDARADAESLRAIADWYHQRDLRPLLALPDRLIPDAHVSGSRVGPPMHALVLPDDPSAAVLVDATDVARGSALRADGFRLHHVRHHVHLDTYGDA
ncbi:hypothetical protein HH308_23380 [Gordonia sp. TBRC 11910]|uniref:Histone acetyltransferase Rv0428c-like C-terminal domain-containing protein n=1 Tax=Gordonia asplenii TaxID=2725283 RepID=A0A848L666_9ACTN|nr:hypothetical protein [Gordonia asplenii]NMO04163.1 hypothetical protein [Gordonia asplenii]